MSTNKNQLREDAISLAVFISDVKEASSNGSYYFDQMLRATSTIGSALCSLKNLREEISIIRRSNLAIDACSDLIFAARVLYAQNNLSEENFKTIKKLTGSIEKRILASLTE